MHKKINTIIKMKTLLYWLITLFVYYTMSPATTCNGLKFRFKPLFFNHKFEFECCFSNEALFSSSSELISLRFFGSSSKYGAESKN